MSNLVIMLSSLWLSLNAFQSYVKTTSGDPLIRTEEYPEIRITLIHFLHFEPNPISFIMSSTEPPESLMHINEFLFYVSERYIPEQHQKELCGRYRKYRRGMINEMKERKTSDDLLPAYLYMTCANAGVLWENKGDDMDIEASYGTAQHKTSSMN
ncbi:hypothetical protein LXL04_003725 [Taraxacum kok-saghyz]